MVGRGAGGTAATLRVPGRHMQGAVGIEDCRSDDTRPPPRQVAGPVWTRFLRMPERKRLKRRSPYQSASFPIGVLGMAGANR